MTSLIQHSLSPSLLPPKTQVKSVCFSQNRKILWVLSARYIGIYRESTYLTHIHLVENTSTHFKITNLVSWIFSYSTYLCMYLSITRGKKSEDILKIYNTHDLIPTSARYGLSHSYPITITSFCDDESNNNLFLLTKEQAFILNRMTLSPINPPIKNGMLIRSYKKNPVVLVPCASNQEKSGFELHLYNPNSQSWDCIFVTDLSTRFSNFMFQSDLLYLEYLITETTTQELFNYVLLFFNSTSRKKQLECSSKSIMTYHVIETSQRVSLESLPDLKLDGYSILFSSPSTSLFISKDNQVMMITNHQRLPSPLDLKDINPDGSILLVDGDTEKNVILYVIQEKIE